VGGIEGFREKGELEKQREDKLLMLTDVQI
jgi:hypothetical protein